VQAGDVVVTSGVGGAFPPGLQVGSIVIATSPNAGVFREAELEPVVEFESLEEVMIVTTRSGSPAEVEKGQEEVKAIDETEAGIVPAKALPTPRGVPIPQRVPETEPEEEPAVGRETP
jgi:hypothetical protein